MSMAGCIEKAGENSQEEKEGEKDDEEGEKENEEDNDDEEEKEEELVYVLTEIGEEKLGVKPVQQYYPGFPGTTEENFVSAVAMVGMTRQQVLEEHMLGGKVWKFNEKDVSYELAGGLVALQKKVDPAEAAAAAAKATMLRKRALKWKIKVPLHAWLKPWCSQ
jgi:hypothetical protein